MNVYRKLVADLLVGDYLQVVSHVPNEDQRPECFRRVEKIEYIEAPVDQFFANRQYTFASGLSPQAGVVIVWCHGVSAPLIYPPGDVTVWANVPEERREWDGEAGWWGSLLEGKPCSPPPAFPPKRKSSWPSLRTSRTAWTRNLCGRRRRRQVVEK